MDYSLVVGVDSDKHELVVGIVDYIRTFTWSVTCRSVMRQLKSCIGIKSLSLGSKIRPFSVVPGKANPPS